MEYRVKNHRRLGATYLAGIASLPPRLLTFPLVIVFQLAAAALGGIGFVLGDPPAAMISGAFLWLVWFGGLFLVASKPADRLLRRTITWLAPLSFGIFLALIVLGSGEVGLFASNFKMLGHSELIDALHRGFYYNDATALTHQATDNLLQGKNPYANENIITALLAHNGASDRTTPRREGEFALVFPYPTPAQLDTVWQEALRNNDTPPPELETRMNYPAGAFELPAPFIWAGLKDLRWIYLIYCVLGIAVATWLCPSKLRVGFLGVVAISLAFWNSVASGETGSLAFPFMLLGWVLARKQPLASAVFMGVAVSVKQTAWFLAPFYLILLLRTIGFKRTLLAASVVSGVFAATNLPFMVQNPALWISSMGAPMSQNFFPLGVGVISIVTSGLLNIQNPLPFTIMEVAAFAAGIAWYYFNCRRYPHAGPILAFLPLFFAWRSLWSYFFYIDIIVLAAVLIDEYGADPLWKSGSQRRLRPVVASR
jgi:hypothetical protein